MTITVRPDPGDKINVPGFYDLSMERYHSDCCIGPSISSSGLRTIVGSSPAQYWGFSPYNPDRFEQQDKPSWTFGRAAHAFLEGEEAFNRGYIVAEADAPAKPTTAMLNSANRSPSSRERCNFWEGLWVEAKKRNAEIISWADFEKIEAMSKVMAADELAPRLLGGMSEVSMVWRDQATGVWLKSRPDVIPADGVLVDFKTAGNATTRSDIFRSIARYRYDMQMALAMMGWIELNNILDQAEIDNLLAILVFQQTDAPHIVMPAPIDAEALYWARCFVRKGIEDFAAGLDTGHWPGPADDLPAYNVSPGTRERYEEMQRNGDLPNLRASIQEELSE